MKYNCMACTFKSDNVNLALLPKSETMHEFAGEDSAISKGC